MTNLNLHLHTLQSVQRYLQLNREYARYLRGVHWSEQHDALVDEDERVIAVNAEVADFLEGFQTAGRVVAFEHVVHWLARLKGRNGYTVDQDRLPRIFHEASCDYRNAGAMAAALLPALPLLPGPPLLEVVIYRLRDKVFPVRTWYRGTQDFTSDTPALSGPEFEVELADLLRGLSDDELRTWLTTGRGSLERSGQQVVEALPVPARTTVAQLVAEVLQRPRLAGAEAHVPRLIGALALPPRRRTPEELPLGGFADVITQGHPQHLLLSQHALDELEFLRRFSERELLYFRREEPPAAHRQHLWVLLDQGARTWGDVRLVLSAAALALAQLADRRSLPFALAATSNRGWPLILLSEGADILGHLLEASDLSANPGLALETLLEQPSPGERDVVLLTHPRSLREADVLDAARRLRSTDRLFAVTLDGEGQAALQEIRHGAAVPVRRFRIDFSASRAVPQPHPASTPVAPTTPWQGDIEPVPMPFVFGTDGIIQAFDFDYEGEHLLTLSHEGMLHVWATDGSRVECLPRPFSDKEIHKQFSSVLGVAGGFVVLCQPGGQARARAMAHYGLAQRTCRIHWVKSEGSRGLSYDRADHCVVIDPHPPERAVVVDLAGGSPGREQKLLQKLHETGYSRQLLDRGRTLPVYTTNYTPTGANHVVVSNLSGEVEVRLSFECVARFLPEANGEPLLRGTWPTAAQFAGSTLALTVTRGDDVYDYLFGLPQGQLLFEIPYKRRRNHLVRTVLDYAGEQLALHSDDQRIKVLDRAGQTKLTVRKGGFSQKPFLWLGADYLLLLLGESYWHLFDWHDRVLKVHAMRSSHARVPEPATFDHPAFVECLRRSPAALAIAETAPPEVAYDRKRFIAGSLYPPSARVAGTVIDVSASRSPPAVLRVALDRFGQVAIFQNLGELLCMFVAFRFNAAGWLPDGTRFGPLADGPALSRELASRFGQALTPEG